MSSSVDFFEVFEDVLVKLVDSGNVPVGLLDSVPLDGLGVLGFLLLLFLFVFALFFYVFTLSFLPSE